MKLPKILAKFVGMLAVCFALFFVLAVQNASAQAVAGVTGVVTDPTGAAVPDVAVKLTNPSTGYSSETKTNSVGAYDIRQVAPGDGYVLTFSKANFRTVIVDRVSLGATTIATHDVSLPVGDITTSIEVTAGSGETLNTTDATVGNEIDAQKVQDLPSLFRINAAALLTLSPGVVSTQDNGPESASQIGAVTGARADQSNITLDGLDVNDERIGQAFTAVGSIPVDSVEEVHIIAGNANVDFGRSSGGQIALVTKSGTNDWHGSLHEYNRNTIFAANDFFDNKAGIGRQPLNRNQYGGSLGGPIKKDKLFFFFNYESLRQNFTDRVEQIVPLDALRNGQLSYINNNPGCDASVRVNSPNAGTCISTFSAAQIQALDPAGMGGDPALLALINSRYPVANDLNAGDGINTGGFLFNPPAKYRNDIYTGRIDYAISSKHKLFARMQYDSGNSDDDFNFNTQQFPGDPTFAKVFDHDRTWVIGETWLPTNNLVNQAVFGVSRQVIDFPADFKPTTPFEVGFGVNGGAGFVTAPYQDFRAQASNVAVPEIRDDLSYSHGKHNWGFGADIKPIRVHSFNANDIQFDSVGLGGTVFGLDSTLRPSDINADPETQFAWDSAFTFLLGRYSGSGAFYNYSKDGTPQAPQTGRTREWAYNEYEFYGQDSWHVRSDLTVTAGLRWQLHGVPYEVNGFEGVPTSNISQIFGARVAAAAQGIEGSDAAPLTSYELGGKANNGPAYYKTDYHDFSPRIGIAYSPAAKDGALGWLLGDRKTSIRAGGGLVYDRVLSTLSFELDEQTYLFDSNPNTPFGIPGDPEGSLATDPRFASLTTYPAGFFPAPPPVTPRPVTPNVDSSGTPIGLANGGFPSFLQFDKNFHTPYAYTASFGIQRELPGKMTLEVDYVGRFGRKLIADGDAGQVLNFKDSASGQFLKQAFAGVQGQVQQGVPVANLAAQPWFENQITTQLEALGFPAGSCPAVGAAFLGQTVSNCTGLAVATSDAFSPTVVGQGDLSSMYLFLTEFGIVPPNSGMYAQTGVNGFIGNYSSSSYNSLIVSAKKRFSSNLTFDFFYTYAHSIDNQSNIINLLNQLTGTGQGLICDLTNARTCRADSIFDVRHLISANYDYYLPVGHGQRWLSNSPGWVNAFLGGWATSGIVTFRTGFPMDTHTGTFPINFSQDAPAVFNGDFSAVSEHIHTDPTTGAIQFFNNQTSAFGAFSFPFGGDTGTRNPIHGPGYFNLDLAVFKQFAMPWSDKQKLEFRWEAFNAFNNVSFAAPSSMTLQNPSGFGVINGTAISPRQMQFSLRYDF